MDLEDSFGCCLVWLVVGCCLLWLISIIAAVTGAMDWVIIFFFGQVTPTF